MFKIDLTGKKAFIAGVADDQGYGWGIAKALAEAGCTIIIGTWTPLMNIFKTSLERGRFDDSRRLSNGNLMEFEKIYPLDATFDTMEQVPEDIRSHKRYKVFDHYAIEDVARLVKEDFESIDILVHSLANSPEVDKPLLETSREGYLAALSASAYSFVSLLQHFGPIMPSGSSALSLTFIAAEKAVPGYGGGMSSAKAALESDTRTLAWEVGRKWGIRVNTISAGPLRSRAARAIAFIDDMIEYAESNAPLTHPLKASHIGNAALFLLTPISEAITGTTIHVDNGLHAMGIVNKGIDNRKEKQSLVKSSHS